ncbi:hypothetical protein [Pseudomonas sp. P9_31]|uniref:hypothetical protein n=1 Tax=Pseudomonas sp. P9_31 TaxID=3043448 RepID=UPI002A36DBAC|nr:hypothetical protein [Pseudomonas sp. P9_31]WPN58060.1 hypothetical protein QMK51_00025 [Pseudomonas sp. P9_31]
MNRFDLHHKHPAACLYAVGLDDRSTGTLLLSLFTIAGTKNSNPPWVNCQSAGWVFSISANKQQGRNRIFATIKKANSVNWPFCI